MHTAVALPAHPKMCSTTQSDLSPLSYCEEKEILFETLQSVAGAFIGQDLTYPYRRFLGWHLFDVDGNSCGFERIYNRDCTDKDGKSFGKNNKRVAADSKPGIGFKLLGADSLASCSHIYIVAGLADGVSVHLATQSPVVTVVGEGNARKIAEAIAEKYPDLKIVVALDNDQTGIACCHRSGMPWAVPAVRNDWSDVRQFDSDHAICEQLTKIRKPIPAFTIKQLTAPKATQNYGKSLVELSKIDDPLLAASFALAIVHKFSRMVPVRLEADELISSLQRFNHLLHVDTLKEIRGRLDWLVEIGKQDAISDITIAPAILKRHNHRIIKTPDDIDVTALQGHNLFKAPMAWGKTKKILAPIAKNCSEKDEPFLGISHLKSLVESMCRGLGTEHYQDDALKYGGAATVRTLTTCINSLLKPNVAPISNRADVVAIDEVNQVFRAIYDRHSLMGKDAKAVGEKLLEIIGRVELALYADAGLNSFTVRLIESALPEGTRLNIFEVEPVDQGRKVELVVGGKPLHHYLGEALIRLEAGERIAFFTDSLPQTEAISAYLKQQSPGLEMVLINSKTTKTSTDAQNFLSNPDEEAIKYQLIVYSPSISSGVSIEKAKVDHVYGVLCGVTTPQDAIQQMGRCRTCYDYTIILQINNANASLVTSEELLIRGAENATGRWTGDYDRLVAQVEADDNRARANYEAVLYWQLKHLCYTVTVCRQSLKDNGVLKDIKEQLEDIDIKGVYEAPNIDDKEYMAIMRGDGISDNPVYQCERYRLRRGLNIDEVTEDDIIFWDKGRVASQIRRFNLAFSDHTPDMDVETLTPMQMTCDKETRHHLRNILTILGMDFDSQGAQKGESEGVHDDHVSVKSSYRNTLIMDSLRVTKDTATSAVDYMVEHADKLIFLGLAPGSFMREVKPTKKRPRSFVVNRPGKPTQFINERLALLGLEMKLSRVRDSEAVSDGNKDNRVCIHTPTIKSVETMSHYANQVAAGRVTIEHSAEDVAEMPVIVEPIVTPIMEPIVTPIIVEHNPVEHKPTVQMPPALHFVAKDGAHTIATFATTGAIHYAITDACGDSDLRARPLESVVDIAIQYRDACKSGRQPRRVFVERGDNWMVPANYDSLIQSFE